MLSLDLEPKLILDLFVLLSFSLLNFLFWCVFLPQNSPEKTFSSLNIFSEVQTLNF